MKCDRSAQLDLAAFLAGEESPEVRDFRHHYPTCPDCSAEVRAWMRVHADLDPPPTKQHPSEELLLQFESQPERMSAVARTSVEGHLKTCPSCRDELRALRGFDFAALDQPVAARSREDAPQVSGPLAWLKGLLATSRAVFLHPAFAYGLVLLLMLPQLSILFSEPSRFARDIAPPTIEERSSDAAPPPDAGTAMNLERLERERRGDVAASRLADKREPPGTREMAAMEKSFHYDAQERSAQVAPEKEAPFEEGADAGGEKDADESLRALGYRRGFAGGASSGGASSRPELTIQMDPSGQNNIPMRDMRGGVTLRIKPQQPVALGSDVAIRIKSADGRRELREIQTASRSDGYLEMRIPPGWMSDGLYSLEVFPLGDHPEKSRLRHEH